MAQAPRADQAGNALRLRVPTRRNFLAAASATALGAAARARAQGAEKINIGLSPYINQATVFMANDLGYFAKMGLEIQMKIFMDGALVVAPMLSGEVEIGIMTPNAGFFNALHRGGPFRAFLCNGQGRRGRAVTAVVVRSDHYDAGIKSLQDLAKIKGKIAAVGAAGSINQYSLGSALKLAGLDPVHDVQWQTTVAQPDIVKQLGQHQIDIAEITYHLAYLAEKQGFCRILFSRDQILPDSQTAIQTVREGSLRPCTMICVPELAFQIAFLPRNYAYIDYPEERYRQHHRPAASCRDA